jgi:hypothetical protein
VRGQSERLLIRLLRATKALAGDGPIAVPHTAAQDDGEASRARDGRLLLWLSVARETRTRTEDTTIFRRGNEPLAPTRLCLHFKGFSSAWGPVTCPANSARMSR